MSGTLRETEETRLGLISAIAAYLLWGVFPLFWRQLGAVDALEVVCHRVVWAFLFLAICLPILLRNVGHATRAEHLTSLRTGSVWLTHGVAATLIAVNWLTFIWAVNHDRVLEASLGYYINPLLSVLLGVLVFKERLFTTQWIAIGVATTGVAIITIADGGLPWPTIVLACTFAMYAMVKKRARLPALMGLLLENASLLLPAIAFLAYTESTRGGVFTSADSGTQVLLVLGGVITIMPLALFAYSAKRIPLSTIGLMQYIAPTMQFGIGAYILAEPFDQWRLLGFAFVWVALAIYMASSHIRRKSNAT